MHSVHKIYKHEMARSESVTEGRGPIIQRSYELIHQLEKKIIVGDLDVNSGQEEILQRTIGRWSSDEVSNNSGLQSTDFAIARILP
jgi:hypothetical protein